MRKKFKTYTHPKTGKEIPSVTTILDIISKGQGFDEWLKRNGEESDTIAQEAADFGTGIHAILEQIGKGVDIDTTKLPPKQRRCIEAFKLWKDENVAEFICTERVVFDGGGEYAGTLDAVVRMKDGRLVALDYKTSSRLYDTYKLQLAAYIRAYELTQPYCTINEGILMRFEKNDEKEIDMQVKKMDSDEISYSIRKFGSAMDLWYWRNSPPAKKESE